MRFDLLIKLLVSLADLANTLAQIVYTVGRSNGWF